MRFQRLELDHHLPIAETLARFQADPCLLLLDSAARHRERDARYSVLTADPVALHRLDHASYPSSPFSPLRAWQQHLAELASDAPADLPPFAGGIAGLMSYELGEAFERLPRPTPADFQTPALLAGLFDWAIVWDHLAGTVTAWVLDLPPAIPHPLSATERLNWIRQRLAQPPAPSHRAPTAAAVTSPFHPSGFRHQIDPAIAIYSDFSRDEYVAAVARVIEYIRAGDIFQANLSQRLFAPWEGTAIELYQRVRQRNKQQIQHSSDWYV